MVWRARIRHFPDPIRAAHTFSNVLLLKFNVTWLAIAVEKCSVRDCEDLLFGASGAFAHIFTSGVNDPGPVKFWCPANESGCLRDFDQAVRSNGSLNLHRSLSFC
ncbi:hypothetical protein [Pseudomonas sp. LS-2]|uniref:hypothetical protein n=1 Tax=Pseudomonas sp. LS-2 TaxID=2315859 RepID=UPI000E72793A|nr:hypothetical protein [Pseudomonas sp. LS-2]RJX74027.1 hypothetical protein D3M70_27335 [Pseudomonas sp. LS-2]